MPQTWSNLEVGCLLTSKISENAAKGSKFAQNVMGTQFGPRPGHFGTLVSAIAVTRSRQHAQRQCRGRRQRSRRARRGARARSRNSGSALLFKRSCVKNDVGGELPRDGARVKCYPMLSSQVSERCPRLMIHCIEAQADHSQWRSGQILG